MTLLAGMDGAALALTYEVAGALDTYPVDGLTTGITLNNGSVVSVNLDENKIFQMRVKIDNSGNPTPYPTCVIAVF